MAAYVQKKDLLISKAPSPAGATITAVSKASPTVLTVTNSATAGDIVRVENTGYTSIDGRAFEVVSATATAITIAVDSTDETAAGTGGTAFIYTDADFVSLCLSSFGYNREAGATITAGTFCGTTTLAGQPGAQTIEFAGFDDPEAAGLEELIQAQLDGIPRVLVYQYPPGASATGASYQIVFPAVVIAGLNGPIATADGAATFSGTGTSNGVPQYTAYSSSGT